MMEADILNLEIFIQDAFGFMEFDTRPIISDSAFARLIETQPYPHGRRFLSL